MIDATSLAVGWKPSEDIAQLLKQKAYAQRPLPEICNAQKLLDSSIDYPAPIIPDFLYRGFKGVLGGSSKAGKTWSLMDMAVSVASGAEWWGMPTVSGQVLYINLEIQEVFFRSRLEKICQRKGIKSVRNLDVWTLRGHARPLDDLLDEIIRRIRGPNYVVVIIDPIYKILGGRDENGATDIAQLVNQLERIAVECNTAIFYAAHYSKGNQAGKEAMDRISGSGVWARDADTIVTLTRHKCETLTSFTVESILRNSAPKEPFVVSWDFPIMVPNHLLDPHDLKQKPGRPKTHTSDDVLNLLESSGMLTKEWRERADDNDISSATFGRLKKELVEARLVHLIDKKWFRVNT